MTPQQRLDALLADAWQPTNAAITIATIRDEIGFTPEQYGLVRGTLETAIATLKADTDPLKRMQGIDLQDALSAMLSRGISLSTQNRQDTIDLLATFGQWPTEVRDAVKGLGGVYVKEWQRQGMASAPTLASVQAAIDAENLATLRDDLRVQFDAILNQIGTDEQLIAVDTLRRIADELEE